MWQTLKHWIDDTPYTDLVERRQAGMLQLIHLGVIAMSMIGIIIGSLFASPSDFLIQSISYLVVLTFIAIGLFLVRRGRLSLAVLLTVLGNTLTITGVLVALGLQESGIVLFSFVIPLAMAGLLADRRTLVLTSVFVGGAVIGVGVLEKIMPHMVRFMSSDADRTFPTVSVFILLVGLFGVLLDRFAVALRESLSAALVREHDLEQLRETLETTVAERTAELREALRGVEQREASLATTLKELNASKEAVRELSAPVLPVIEGVLVAPLIGAINDERASTLAINILEAIERRRSRHVIFDITGVPVVDTQVAQVLLETAEAARLLGAQVMLVGIRPEVAQTIVSLGVDFSALTPYPNLQEAVESLLGKGHLAH